VYGGDGDVSEAQESVGFERGRKKQTAGQENGRTSRQGCRARLDRLRRSRVELLEAEAAEAGARG
jgi:hypothetical protein